MSVASASSSCWRAGEAPARRLGPHLGQAVLGEEDAADLLEVVPEQVLQLADAGHPLDVGGGVAAGAAHGSAGRGQQVELLVVPQRPGGDPGLVGGVADGEQRRYSCEDGLLQRLADVVVERAGRHGPSASTPGPRGRRSSTSREGLRHPSAVHERLGDELRIDGRCPWMGRRGRAAA